MTKTFDRFAAIENGIAARRSTMSTTFLDPAVIEKSIDFYVTRTAMFSDEIVGDAKFMVFCDLNAADASFLSLKNTTKSRFSVDQIAEVFDAQVATPLSRRVKYDDAINRVFVRNDDGLWESLELKQPELTRDKLSMLLARLFPSVLVSLGHASNRCAEILLNTLSTHVQTDYVTRIQFSDGVLTQGGDVIDSMNMLNESPVGAICSYDVLNVDTRLLELRSTPGAVAVERLLEHVADSSHDHARRDRLVDMLALGFVLDTALKQKLQRLVFLHGFGGDGKSIFINLLRRAYGPSLSTDIQLANFGGFYLEQLPGKLVIFDEDCSENHLDAEVTSNLKKVINAGTIQINRKNKSVLSVKSQALVVAAGNALPTSSDKTDGWLRRFEVYNVARLDVETNAEWIDDIKTRDAAEYMFCLLLSRAIEIMKTGAVTEKPQTMVEDELDYAMSNSSVRMWLESSGGASAVEYRKPATAYLEYAQWCEDNAEIAYKKNKFTSLAEHHTRTKVKQIAVLPEMGRAYDEIVLGSAQADLGRVVARVFVPLHS